MSIALVSTAMLLAGILGLAAHRASICSVVAVAEILEPRRPDMLISFAKTALWIIAVTVTLAWLAEDAVMPVVAWQLTALGLLGGFIFGVGSTINDGCAFSTLRKLINGKFVILLTLLGFALGSSVMALLASLQWSPEPIPTDPLINARNPLVLGLLFVVVAWISWECVMITRYRRLHGHRAPHYRLALSAALMGLSNGILFALLGPWMYTAVVGQQVDYALGHGEAPRLLFWLLFGSVVAGMAVSAWRTGRFRARWSFRGWGRCLFGGVLMGVGAGLVPGGNDVLILHGIPGFSPHAVPVFVAMLIGIALALLIQRRLSPD